jgi:copper homeostasis protein
VLEAAPPVRVTFHRAFDTLRSPLAAIGDIATLPQVDRILTSGGGGSAVERAARLREWSQRANDLGLTIIAGGGVDEEALAHFAATPCVNEVHVGRIAREGGDQEAPVSAARVQGLRGLLSAVSR